MSNNDICPNFSTRLYSINVTGNTQISAGSSSTFYATLEQPAANLTIVPSCASSAISFSPAQLVFSNYDSKAKTFTISAANGLTGSFEVTFAKQEGGSYTFYNDIQSITLQVYAPTSKYPITVSSFTSKSVGAPIEVNLQLEVASPTSFTLLSTSNCSSSFIFNPASRITVPAQSRNVSFTVAYSGDKVPAACSQTFTISSLTTNNYYLKNPTVYYSAALSIDKTWVESPMLLTLSTTPK